MERKGRVSGIILYIETMVHGSETLWTENNRKIQDTFGVPPWMTFATVSHAVSSTFT